MQVVTITAGREIGHKAFFDTIGKEQTTQPTLSARNTIKINTYNNAMTASEIL